MMFHLAFARQKDNCKCSSVEEKEEEKEISIYTYVLYLYVCTGRSQKHGCHSQTDFS